MASTDLGQLEHLRRLLQPTAVLDDVRATEFARLDAAGHVYLDHTGAGLYPRSLVDGHLAMLRTHVLGNPHSVNPTSRPATDLVESARAAVLAHVGADPAEYACIFTANATGALKLVGESYGFGADRPLLLTSDNHNSVNGIREFARSAGAPVRYLPVHAPDLRLDPDRADRRAGRRPAGPVRVPGPVQLLRRAAPAGPGCPGPGTGLGRAPGRRRLRPHQRGRPGGDRRGLPGRVLLQDVRLSHRGRSPRRPPIGPGPAAPAVVRRRHHRHRVGRRGRPPPGAGPRRVRGRHAELPVPAGGGAGPGVPQRHRHDHRPRPGHHPHRLAAGPDGRAGARHRTPAGAHPRPRRHPVPGRHHHLHPVGSRWRRAQRPPRGGTGLRRRDLAPHRGASATRGRGDRSGHRGCRPGAVPPWDRSRHPVRGRRSRPGHVAAAVSAPSGPPSAWPPTRPTPWRSWSSWPGSWTGPCRTWVRCRPSPARARTPPERAQCTPGAATGVSNGKWQAT